MFAFCVLKMVTPTSQLKFPAILLSSLVEQVSHSSSTVPHHLSMYKKDQGPSVQFVAQDLEEKLYCGIYLVERMMRTLPFNITISQGSS